jgi:hypothetical protein
MTTLSRIASALLGASALAFSLSANAETKAPPARHHAVESAFPMKAEAFKKLVDTRIDHLKAHFAEGLTRRSLTPAQKGDIDKAMDGAMKELHAAVDKVGADGLVTTDEAKRIKGLSEQLRSKMRAELRGRHAYAKAKGAKAGRTRHGKSAAASKKAPKDASAAFETKK